MSPAERQKREIAVGVGLSHQLDQHLHFKQDSEVSVYLRALAERLTEATPALKASPVGVLIISDIEGKWRNLGLPGNRIYLSSGLLRTLEFENELAAAIALELSHLMKRHALERLVQNREDEARSSSSPMGPPREKKDVMEGLILPADESAFRRIEYFGTNGIFTFSAEMHQTAAEEAVKILYRAGFDPRGLSNLLGRFQKHPGKSPFDPGVLEKVLDATRREIARNAPLRNPVVRSQSFLAIQKRIQKL